MIHDSLPVGIVLERRKVDHPWQRLSWHVVAVIPGAPALAVLFETAKEAVETAVRKGGDMLGKAADKREEADEQPESEEPGSVERVSQASEPPDPPKEESVGSQSSPRAGGCGWPRAVPRAMMALRRALVGRSGSSRPPAEGPRPRLRGRLGGGPFVALLLAGAAPASADMIGHGGVVRAVAVAPDGDTVLSGSFDYTAKVWDFVEQNELAELNEHFGPVNAVAFLPDGRRVLTASDDKTLILWDLETKAPLRRFTGHGAKIMALAVSRDGRLAASGGWDRTLRLWDIATGEQIRAIEQPSNVNALAFGDRGGSVVSGAHDGVLRVWRVNSGALLAEMRGHDWGVTQIAISPDGTRALSSSTDESLRLWDLATYKEVRSMTGHDGPVLAAAFSPDGRTALSAGLDGLVIHWDVATGRHIRAIRAHPEPVWAVAFTPDGRFGVSASSDERVRVWHLQTGDQIGIAEEGKAEPKPWLESRHPGAKLFRKCANCHSLKVDGPRRSGPHFAGLFGRRVGSVPGYKYSPALQGADFVWNGETLRALFDEGPDIFLPGTKMPMQRVSNGEQLSELIQYMREITAPPGADTKPVDGE